jgi:hypothetical protein
VGLDLVVEGRAKSGHEVEWRQILERSFRDDPRSDDEARFQEISIAPHEAIGAPRVGESPEADQWVIKAQNAATPEETARVLAEFDGYYVLQLVRCDGISEYTHAGLYEGIDETSFRGKFLEACTDVLSPELIELAWEHRFPQDAIEYGNQLLNAAEKAVLKRNSPTKPSFLNRLGFGKTNANAEAFDEQVKIVTAAGNWYVFWGERQHAIRAWF